MNDCIKIAHINIRSLLPKFDDLKYLLYANEFDILIVTESWLSGSYTDELIVMDGYSAYRRDRYGRGGWNAHGEGGITNEAIKCLPKSPIARLVTVINSILSSEDFSSVWKDAVVVVIDKPGKDSALPESYRPINLLSNLVILGRFRMELTNLQVLPDEQFGFRSKYSADFQLQTDVTRAVFHNIQRVFDAVWRQDIAYKMMVLRINDSIIRLVRSYLSNKLSRRLPMRSGVPQDCS
ncbi:reverse transcriptase (rna-dependent dna polymerase) [Holotrichia oblita]|uniref:Reverse transcriptase (Rna-dependent dna polymerase) n=1 Tax=Holotrichia oblita TaxID=644536 RepID=A0ACB9TIU9_HOLOL|nr:reverse transcriptase (rna-dependent dna polymerase) [Holotrichia oblita]